MPPYQNFYPLPLVSLVTYNVNGIRSAMRKGLCEWIEKNNFDIICFQETKAQPEQIDTPAYEKLGYKAFWYSAEKKGYSGVGILSKIQPDQIVYGCGIPHYDREGRTIRADFGDTTLLNTYFPSGTSGEIRQEFKYKFLDEFQAYINDLRKIRPKIILCGDYNIAHNPIDIHDPVRNKNTTGFLLPERDWLTKFFGAGWIDSFRKFNQDPHQYTWWSAFRNARATNRGWRIDYISVTADIEENLEDAKILSDAVHSDHCPVMLKLNI